MTVSIKEFRREQQLTAVRLVKDTNLAGTYYNGTLNNGVGATFTTNATTLTIDSVAVENGNRVMLVNQTNSFENGIYQVSNVNDPASNVVLTRTNDFQMFDQIRPGYYIPVSAGAVYSGATFSVVEPQVQQVGVTGVTIVNTVVNSDITSVLLNNTGLNIRGSDEGFHVTVVPDETFSANRQFSFLIGDSNRVLDMSSGDVIFSAYGDSVVAAADKVALQNLLGIRAGVANEPSFGATRTFITLGVKPTDSTMASVLISENPVTIDRVVPGTDLTTVTFDGNAGNVTIMWISIDRT